jgi:hypothetical protein
MGKKIRFKRAKNKRLWALSFEIKNRIKISDFRREVNEDCGLLGYCVASSGKLLPTFRDNPSFPSSAVKS